MREEEKNRSSQKFDFRKILRKKWVLPAIYLLSAAAILSGVLWYQSASNDESLSNEEEKSTDISFRDEPAVEVNAALENFKMPINDVASTKIVKKFYEDDGTPEEQEAALVFYNNTYQPNQGIDIASEDGKDFDVVASLSGTVLEAKEDPLFGYVIELEHEKGVVTRYLSLQSVEVEKGDEVKQGQVLGKAGENQFNTEDGIHVHFEVRKDDMAYNPEKWIEKSLSSFVDAQESEADTEESEEEQTEDGSSEDDNEESSNEPETSDDSIDS
ncbi:M23 family metallopeptidase [Bacillus carboniphilus]|uniref:M23 family metallopeptidase n=1 Tax=Bacillus carboniphilus TaxID=86663 RepID=A0ABY9JQD8_9BACI|nr:M23 family metallopeptidase [Bacillus carboniphilus]WLR41619.1 M23 family metallopeptidase [Bacillus carboniphilus]